MFRGLLACLVPKGKRECQELALETQENKVQGDKKVTEVSWLKSDLIETEGGLGRGTGFGIDQGHVVHRVILYLALHFGESKSP